MAPTNLSDGLTPTHRCYTTKEAVEYMKELDKHPTTRIIGWRDCKTSKPVSIVYN